MTQKYLGRAIGFPEKTADVRMAQYESGSRTPKEKMTADIAHVLGVDARALSVPDIDSYIGLAHTLFALEDIYGLKVNELDGEVCLAIDRRSEQFHSELSDMLRSWYGEALKLKRGEITQEEYDEWRYSYPRVEAERFKQDVDALRQEKNRAEKNTE
jgi:DNA-binding XRE family transcriptional regulator